MSRIGKKPIPLPAGVTASVESGTLTVKGPKGQLAMQMLDDLVKYEIADGEIRVTPLTDAQRNRAAWGMTRTNVQNLVTGVTEGFTKVLEITGVGYRAQAQGRNLRLQLGYSHDVNYKLPEGVDVKTPDQNTVEISGSDGLASAVVDHLGIDMPARAMDRKARLSGRMRTKRRAHAPAAAVEKGEFRHGYFFLPSLRKIYSPRYLMPLPLYGSGLRQRRISAATWPTFCLSMPVISTVFWSGVFTSTPSGSL
jgi:large subunit ribosomal protein L6